MVKCRACGLEHPSGMRCEQAKRLLGMKAQDAVVIEPPSSAVPERVVKSETVVFKCPVCEARKERQREKMRDWRKKK